jgi:hypothetical protein
VKLQQRRVYGKAHAAVLYQRPGKTSRREQSHMLENQENNRATEDLEAPQSPSEKLEENKPLGSLTPGAENEESPEIKNEINPNTE